MNVLNCRQGIAAIIGLITVALLLCEAADAAAAKKTKIYQIDKVKLSVSAVSKINVTAMGKVGTGGWTDPQLVPSSKSSKKADDPNVVTLHFDFVASKPTGVATEAITEIGPAEATCPAPGAGKTLKVIVHSETNEKSDTIKSPNDPR
jgi:hypothetical protein